MDQENNTDFEIRKNTYKSYLDRNKTDSTRIQNTQTTGNLDDQQEKQDVPRPVQKQLPTENTQNNPDDGQNPESRIQSRQSQNQQISNSTTNIPKQRIDWIAAILMIWLALFYDGIQFLLNFIPVVGNLLSAILIGLWAWLSFYIWFKIKGVNFSKPTRSITLFGAGITEMVPLLNVLPAWTLAVLILIATTKAEDTIGLKIPTKKIHR